MDNYGLIVRRIREALGMSKAELARRTGISESYISRLEKGSFKSGNVDMLRKLSRGFNMSLPELQSKLDDGPAPKKDIDAMLAEVKMQFPPAVKVYASLSDALAGRMEVYKVVTARRTPDDEDHLFGIKCTGKWLPMALKAGATALVDKREAVHEGNVVVWESNGETVFGVYHQLGDKKWADNARGSFPLDGETLYVVTTGLIDLSNGID